MTRRPFALVSLRALFLFVVAGLPSLVFGDAAHHHSDGQTGGGSGFFANLFSTDFMPHGHCYFWRPEIVWLHVISDALIGISYFSIPLMVLYFLRKRKGLPFPGVLLLFAGFIFCCGMTHFLSIVTLWTPVYRIDGLAKAVTAAISVATAVYLFPMIPRALLLKSADDYERKQQDLEAEVTRRQGMEAIIQRDNEELELRVAQRTQALENSNRDLERFAYVASHDLKEPLRTVALHAQLLADRYGPLVEPSEPSDSPLYHLTAGVKRMQAMIDGVLTYSRIGKDLGPKRTLETSALVEQALENLKFQLEETRAVVDVDALPSLRGEETELVQLFQNLISNAIKYNDKNPPRIHVSAEKKSDAWWFSVQDNGIGIAQRYADRIFTLFGRLHGADEYQGTGIGLAITKKIVEAWGGRIWFESVEGKGTRFVFSVPLSEVSETPGSGS